MKITSTKGTTAAKSIREAAAWIAEYQPSHVSIEVAGCDTAIDYDADTDLVEAIEHALGLELPGTRVQTSDGPGTVEGLTERVPGEHEASVRLDEPLAGRSVTILVSLSDLRSADES